MEILSLLDVKKKLQTVRGSDFWGPSKKGICPEFIRIFYIAMHIKVHSYVSLVKKLYLYFSVKNICSFLKIPWTINIQRSEMHLTHKNKKNKKRYNLQSQKEELSLFFISNSVIYLGHCWLVFLTIIIFFSL